MNKIIEQLIEIDTKAKEIIKKAEEDVHDLPNLINKKASVKILETEMKAKETIERLKQDAELEIDKNRRFINESLEQKLVLYTSEYKCNKDKWAETIFKGILK